MKNISLGQQLADRQDDHANHEFAKQIDAEAQVAERGKVIAFLENRAAYLNRQGDVGNTFRVDEIYTMVRDIKDLKHHGAH